ncbi:hypothetical protein [Flavobacterium sp. NRK F7]|uniref:hypothetical protein n=1 Tax=Flavobacterium sp. NRK F7 TaxID=2954930 RepID=UPI0020919553|nr:hypothetical protein [Flavobacterium sp. NRK F7]MCO6161761.1 hypothetical protein [Flavobacterium sp. NRK F7]
MKNILLFILCSCFTFAQVPQGMSHRGIAYNSSGVVLTNTDIGVRVRILDNGASGTIVYEETHNRTTNNNGQYNFNIGEGIVQGSNNFSDINWSIGNKFLEIAIDPTNGTNYSVIGSSQLMSVPYALFSSTTENTNPNKSITTIKTIEELKNFIDFNPEQDFPVVYVQGYSSPSDGGGGMFIFKRYSEMGLDPSNAPLYTNDPRKPINDDGIFIHSYHGSFSPKGIWIRQFSGDIDLRFYGAFTGGVDITEKLQKAIDYAHKSTQDISTRPYGYGNSNTVYIANGSYQISQVVLKSNVNLKGSSMLETTIVTTNDNSGAMFIKDNGYVRNINISDLTLYGTALNYTGGNINIKGCFNFDSEGQLGGIWDSTFKNLTIQFFYGQSIYFSAGGAGNFQSVNQFITMENVGVESVGQMKTYTGIDNVYHALVLRGSCNQFLFNNCKFDGGSYLFGNGSLTPLYRVNGIPVYIGGIEGTLYNPAVVKFNLCTIQNGQEGVFIQSSNNINLDTCWFEFFERAIVVKGDYRISKAINITNSSFLNSSGRYGELPPNSGSLVIVNKSKISFTNNYIVNSRGPNDDYFNDPANETHKLISLDPYPSDNFGINTSGNYFEDTRTGFDSKTLGATIGIKKDIDFTNISSDVIDIEGAKAIYIKNTSGTIKDVKEFKSTISAGEIFFIRSDQGSIKFDETKNIYLGNMNGVAGGVNTGSLTLTDGSVALFIKIDEVATINGVTYNETYNLVSYKLKN